VGEFVHCFLFLENDNNTVTVAGAWIDLTKADEPIVRVSKTASEKISLAGDTNGCPKLFFFVFYPTRLSIK
jgi:hypothetical protein